MGEQIKRIVVVWNLCYERERNVMRKISIYEASE
jgi:hypothetical protein